MNTAVLVSMLATSVAAASPLLLAALGELVVERSGVLNLGIEGIMLLGALTAAAATFGSGSVVVGIASAIAASSLLGLLFAFLTVTIRADHVVAGLALVLFGDGLSSFAGHDLVGTDIGQHVPPLALPWISDIPALGQIFFRQNALVYFSYLMVGVVWYFLYRTRPGLALRAAGEKPSAVDVVGWNVFRIRYLAVLFGASMAGLAGAFLSVAYLTTWAEGMTAGRGWVALALVIFAGWHPIKLLGGAYLFGFAYILIAQSQVLGGVFHLISTYVMQMFPYLMAIAVLAVMGRRAMKRRVGAPEALALPYVREER
ncbi:ABC transporter permease [Bradyrhizobium sp.]|jgi:simple sugar transport system permease protein|uniref:ABC transporter permease n=1 Tax=Bradyrhizobium sp. TaxID=376 RepID=UPI003C162489